MCVSKTSDHLQIKMKMLDLSQKPQVSSKAPKEDLRNLQNQERQYSENGCIKDQLLYSDQDQDAKPQSGPLHIQNQDREPKFRTTLY